MTKNKWRKEIKVAVEGEECTLVKIKQGKKHNKVHIILPNGRRCKIFTASSPSDSRKGRLNFRNDIRKVKNEAYNVEE